MLQIANISDLLNPLPQSLLKIPQLTLETVPIDMMLASSDLAPIIQAIKTIVG